MRKKRVDYLLSLNALLGAYGVRTSLLMSNQDYFTCAAALWPGKVSKTETLEDLQKAIKGMSKNERRALAKSNIHLVPENFISTADKHVSALMAARKSSTETRVSGGELLKVSK